MKKAPPTSLVSDIPDRVFDQSAETVAELAEATGRSIRWMTEFARGQVNAGRWERVSKKVNNFAVPAYRRAK